MWESSPIWKIFTWEQTTRGPTWMHYYHWKNGLFTEKGDSKNQSQRIILTLDLTPLKFNGLLTIFFIEILSNGEQRFDELKIGCGAWSWGMRVWKELHGSDVGLSECPLELDCACIWLEWDNFHIYIYKWIIFRCKFVYGERLLSY